ncbi:MAG: heme lyase CcmF/NrfE family subunit [Xanthomonadales bacterium]|nr:heme lyase CcmF/NrfE family subunit [Xanthomonadales bacterium]
MVPELGQFALVLALLLAIVQATLPLIGAHRGNTAWMAVARPAVYGQTTFVAIAFAALTYAFVTQDFSVAYVAQNSNLLLPVPYRVSAVWGAHEGSLLLWVLTLTIWSSAVAYFSRSVPDGFIARVLGVMGWISIGFILFTLLTSNPFLRHVPALPDGNDLNPLLQDPGLIVHPPMLYMGYVGFSVAFAFAIAALLEGRVDSRWIRWARPWTNIAWAFLTLGIALGSWWAYYELGWGGWWFWDPVENASFMPWLVGTALIHSQAVTEKRGAFKTWTILLSIAAFSLSLLGTFLVRSGVLTSVHAFASDPERGMFILGFLAVVCGGALFLYALRAPKIATGGQFTMVSRETLLLINNLFMTSACAMVLLGTLYPLLADAMGWGKISVGPPYFGLLFILLMIPIIVLMPVGPYGRWREDQASRLIRISVALAVISVVAGAAPWIAWQDWSLRGITGTAGAFWVILMTGRYLWERRKSRLGRGAWGMVLAHLGVGVFLVGVTMVETRGLEKDIAMRAGDTFEVNGYEFQFRGVDRYNGPNYLADRGTFDVVQDGDVIAVLQPEKRGYSRGGNIMTEAAIDPGLTRDLYVSLGEPLGDNNSWAVRIYHKPFIRWIWLGSLMMMFGGFLAATDRRYVQEARASRKAKLGDDLPGTVTA